MYVILKDLSTSWNVFSILLTLLFININHFSMSAIMSLVRAFLGAFKEFYKNLIREVVAI